MYDRHIVKEYHVSSRRLVFGTAVELIDMERIFKTDLFTIQHNQTLQIIHST